LNANQRDDKRSERRAILIPANIKTVQDAIQVQAKRNPDALCCSLRVGGSWIDYDRRTFYDLVQRYAGLFRRVAGSSKIILFLKKLDIHLLTAYIGAMAAGHIPAQISPQTIKVNDKEYLQRISHIRAITNFSAIFTEDTELISRNELGDTLIFSVNDLPETPRIAEPISSGDALVQFSSGSTGLQKGVVLTHEAILAHMKNYSGALHISPSDSIVTWLPLYHDMGLIACYLMPLMCGLPFYQIDPLDWIVQPNLLLKIIEEKKPTVCFQPNFAYHVLAQKGHAQDLSSVRLWINCSEPTRKHSHDVFLEKFPSVKPESLTVCYALAENTFAVSQTTPWHNNSTRLHPDRDVLSCGRPIPGVEVKIHPSANHDDGEIGVRSPSIFSRFMDNSTPLTEDGYYMTGDLGFIDEQGELYITGRKKDVIIVNGKNIFPQDVEYAVSGIAGIYPGRAVAFGIWDEEAGSENLIVLAERTEGERAAHLKAAIQKAILDEVGIVPKRVEIVEHMTLVKTSSGKVSRSRNKELYLAKEFTLL
jgi:fatty-acyl-CoA synthase